ncbi:uncharacterized protein LOC5579161 [Aedes aegypti]|uniref:Uncharacterized protein n=1 Tax=Aedes aegypti TaxID=7159 RepID=A0A6I8TMF8_AEDAE|nr:uncharacterized protein LOC5579161 [Aedes aegypti]XP_021694182.1 uncharacterized protein LOC5579161 [Aedes aegypti]XP_021694186.1 uncharacterized protein LOC5579161 [Aedes aegypti]XP_021694194.1 uncharacterized protein LOC5579161 [Aedes aegypti]XP_021694200.1 uncharacterized protein LOC5579161 [Aedes aegypti]XP_021694207.1 uncharacterized protein LOC5579161 [Aedes aegypti]XP_021694212.1 uncharacterized protein LOC5579161 [Aedes aegypti]XP_021694219.1 uncharacterized protein LOC5579161 [Ae
MSSGKRASSELTASTAPVVEEERPHSFYDNITAGSSSGTTKPIQIPDIQFKFDDEIPITNDPRRSALLMSNAKSDFFGLPQIPSAVPEAETDASKEDHSDETERLIADQDRSTPPAVIVPPVASSPASTTSTAPARSTDSPGPSESPKSRPVSSHRNITIKLPDAGTPSEAVYMTTTVPQNFSKNANNLIGRHKPTRSSLRHSRMLMVNKSVPQRYPKGNSLNLKHIRLSRILMILEIVVGTILTLVGMTIIVWSPNTHTKDNPYWAGMILTLCGTLFLILFDFKRRPSNRLRENFFNFFRVNAMVILLLTIFFTMLAFIYALIHTTNLSSEHLRCAPEYRFNVNSSSCVCLIDTRGVSTDVAASELRSGEEEDGELDGERRNGTAEASRAVMSGFDLRRAGEMLEEEGVIWLEYRDFNCSEVLSVWYYIALSFAILSSLGCLLASSFLVIYAIECQRRHEQEQKYFTVRTNGDAPSTTTSSNRTDQRISEENESKAAANTTTLTSATAVQDSGGGSVTTNGNMTSVTEEADATTAVA